MLKIILNLNHGIIYDLIFIDNLTPFIPVWDFFDQQVIYEHSDPKYIV